MTERKHLAVLAGFVLSVSLAGACLTAWFLAEADSRMYTLMLGSICQKIIEKQPEAEPAVLAALKDEQESGEPAARKNEWESGYTGDMDSGWEDQVFFAYGYGSGSLCQSAARQAKACAATGFAAGAAVFLMTLFFWHKKETERIRELTDYLENVNTGGSGILAAAGEDEFSRLQDEIYKTVTMLYQTRDGAVKAGQRFAENLFNIAHQLKTPVTSISLSVQMCLKEPSKKYLEQIRRQLYRLSGLEESLLLLSRIDSGTLPLDRKKTGVFTLLTLAADNLQELLQEADVRVQIPELGEAAVEADLEWTMEAVMNLFKNCMEHTPPGGTIHCSYEQNPVYTQIRIWDTGAGFAKKDIPYLFERFYRGENAAAGGIGIGLALSRSIIERQNGTVRAYNLPGQGACFEIRFYRH